MQVMKFSDRGVSSFEHFYVKLLGYGLGLLRRHFRDKVIHDLAPGPEVIVPLMTLFGVPGKCTLKSMRVEIGHAR